MTPVLPPSWRSPVAWWGIAGVLVLLSQAIVRLTPIALEPLRQGDLTPLQQGLAAAWVGGMVWAEGWRGFHQRFAPRVIVRASHVHAAPRLVQALAPLACMGLIWATRRRRIASRALLAGVVTAVISVRWLPYPWRGVVDAGVVAGLAVGVASILWHLGLALAGHPPDVDPQLPDTPPQAVAASQVR